jgi:hypothetical protein
VLLAPQRQPENAQQIQTAAKQEEKRQQLHLHQTGIRRTDLQGARESHQKVNLLHLEKAVAVNIKYYWLPLYQWFTQRKQTFARWI